MDKRSQTTKHWICFEQGTRWFLPFCKPIFPSQNLMKRMEGDIKLQPHINSFWRKISILTHSKVQLVVWIKCNECAMYSWNMSFIVTSSNGGFPANSSVIVLAQNQLHNIAVARDLCHKKHLNKTCQSNGSKPMLHKKFNCMELVRCSNCTTLIRMKIKG